MPRLKRKGRVEIPNKKIDSYFKPVSKVKRKIENDENSQENARPSPSPPSSQTKPLKTFDGNATGTTTFGLKSENENTGLKSFGGLGKDRENIGSKPFGLQEKDGYKTFGTTNALKWEQIDRQPLREKPITPVNTLKMPSISRPVQHTFQVLSDQEIERGIEQSTSRSKYDDKAELNTQCIEVSSSLDSNHSNCKSPILSYSGGNNTQDSFVVYADEDQISDTVRGGITDSVTNSDNESSPEDKFEVYVDNKEDDKFEVYVDNKEDDKFEVYVDNKEDDKFEVYIDNKEDDKFEASVDNKEEAKSEIFLDNEEVGSGVYINKDDEDNESDQDSKFEVYVNNNNDTPSNNKFEVYVDDNDTTITSNSTKTEMFQVYIDPELRPQSFNVHNDTRDKSNEGRRYKENESAASDNEEKLSNVENSPILKRSSSTLPDLYKQGTNSLSAYGSSLGFFDEYKEGELVDEDDQFSVGHDGSTGFTLEFKKPATPLFSSKKKHLFNESKEQKH